MGNITSDVGACCSSERLGSQDDNLIELEGTFVVCKHPRPGQALQLAFTEWEEIIALSRAFAPGWGLHARPEVPPRSNPPGPEAGH